MERMLRKLATDLWVIEHPLRFWGLEVGCRMTAIRLANGDLLLHSPVRLDADLRRELDALGPVRYAIAPNRLHHLYAGEVSTHYPQARLWIASGLERKRPDLALATVLTDEAPPEWRGQIEQLYFRGRPFENEVVFLHRPSRTLLLCDLAFNFGPSAPWLTRMIMTAMGGYGQFRPTRLDPLLIRNRPQARQSLETILTWDFDRVIIAHGEVLESGGREMLRAGYHWLLKK
jgi:hypothetical protein